MRFDDDDDIISLGQLWPQKADGFTDQAFDAIAFDGRADAAGNAQSPAGMREIVGHGEKYQRAARGFAAGFVNGGEGGFAGEAVGCGE